ncbi:MAG: F0F1 ATP synthase subunit A [Candidatus Falkowbacteria bacterium]
MSENQINNNPKTSAETGSAEQPTAHEGAVEPKAEIKTQHTLYAEPIANIGGFTVTNSLLSSWIVLIIILCASLALRKRIKMIPGRAQSIFEMLIDQVMQMFDTVTGSREKTKQIAPLIFTFFFFILINNWFGLLPGVGSFGQVIKVHNELEFVPYLRGATADLNTTLALAAIGLVVSNIFGIMAVGASKHFNKFINIKTLLEIPKKIKNDWTVILVNPINVFIGLVETISEVAKGASLSLRLYGNIFAGEVLLASISGMLAFGLPLPFMALEIFVGLVQAFIFSILVLVYITLHTSHEEH